MRYAIGIDIGGTFVKAAAMTAGGERLALRRFDTGEAGAWAETAKACLAAFEREYGAAAGVCVAAPGLADPNDRGITWMQGRMAPVEGFDWKACLGRPVPVLNDAHAALLGEQWRGAAAGSRNAVLLTLGTGVGGAIVCDGRLLRGHIGRAGHLGHVSLDPDGPPDLVNTPGSLEDMIGDHTVAAHSDGRFGSTAELVAAFAAGDAGAGRVWLRSVRALAAAVASFVNVVDPEVIVIGGGIAQAGPALFEPLAREMDAFEWRPHGHRVRIVPAALGEFAGAVGAARRTLDREEGTETT